MSGRLNVLQFLRLVAAAMVLIQHSVYLSALKYGINIKAFFRLRLGGAGVSSSF